MKVRVKWEWKTVDNEQRQAATQFWVFRHILFHRSVVIKRIIHHFDVKNKQYWSCSLILCAKKINNSKKKSCQSIIKQTVECIFSYTRSTWNETKWWMIKFQCWEKKLREFHYFTCCSLKVNTFLMKCSNCISSVFHLFLVSVSVNIDVSILTGVHRVWIPKFLDPTYTS